MRHPAAGGQLADLPRVDRWLGGEVEPVQITHCREVRDLVGHRDAPFITPCDLALAQQRQRLAQRQLAPGRLVQQAVQLVVDRGQVQPAEPAEQRGVVLAHDQPPPTACSYSASGRSSAGGSLTSAATVLGRATPVTV